MNLPDFEPFSGLSLEQFALLSFMKHWSENLWAAGWYMDLEYALTRVGPGSGRREDLVGFQEAYRAVIELADGWFTHDGTWRPQFMAGSFDELLAKADASSSGARRDAR